MQLIPQYKGRRIPINPAAIADVTLEYWFAARLLTGLSDGNAIVNLTDQSGFGNTPTQATGSKQAIYKTNIINGHPVARFGGDDIYTRTLASTTGFNSASGMVIVVFARTGTSANQTFIASSDEATNTSYWSCKIDNNQTCFNQQSSGDTLDRIRCSSFQTQIGVFQVISFISTGDTYEIRENTELRSLNVVSGANTGDWLSDTAGRDNFSIGGLKRATEAQFGEYDLAEILCYSGYSIDARRTISAYCRSLYGVGI